MTDGGSADDQARTPSSVGGDDAPVSAALQIKFWLLVLVFNLALLGLSVGAMFLVFENDWTLGSQLFTAGAILFGFGLYRYRKVRRRLDKGDFEGVAGDDSGDE